MTYPIAIAIGAALIADAVLLSNKIPPAEAKSGEWVGIGVSSDGEIAWIINTETGAARVCLVVPAAELGDATCLDASLTDLSRKRLTLEILDKLERERMEE